MKRAGSTRMFGRPSTIIFSASRRGVGGYLESRAERRFHRELRGKEFRAAANLPFRGRARAASASGPSDAGRSTAGHSFKGAARIFDARRFPLRIARVTPPARRRRIASNPARQSYWRMTLTSGVAFVASSRRRGVWAGDARCRRRLSPLVLTPRGQANRFLWARFPLMRPRKDGRRARRQRPRVGQYAPDRIGAFAASPARGLETWRGST
jgi:hypothetical protein